MFAGAVFIAGIKDIEKKVMMDLRTRNQVPKDFGTKYLSRKKKR
jgi:hypothetical protein